MTAPDLADAIGGAILHDETDDAVRLVRETAYDAVLMDLQMPRMDGVAATAIIRTLPGREALPIVALTASSDANDRARGFAAGISDFLTKPLEPTELARVLARWVR